MELTQCKTVAEAYAEFGNECKKLEAYKEFLDRVMRNPADMIVRCNDDRMRTSIRVANVPHACIIAGVQELVRLQQSVVANRRAQLEAM